MSSDIKKIVEEDSPWHNPDNKDWYLKDGTLREVIKAENEGLYHPPKIKYILTKHFLEPLFKDPNKYGVLILRGPRRVGKTSTLKYIIKEYLDGKADPQTFVYLSLDKDELFIGNEKRRFLRELVKEIIQVYKKQNKPLVIILDEVSFYEGWARALKNLLDEGEIGPGVLVIATGSYSIDLSSAKRELSGRAGPLSERFGEELFFYPRRFIEIAETSLGKEFQKFVSKNFGLYSKRIRIIEKLTGEETEDNIIFDNDLIIPEEMLKLLIDKYYDSLHNLFENVYVYSGGYPKSLYEATASQSKGGGTKIPDARYREDIYDLLVTDSKKFKISEDLIKEILKKITFPSMKISENYLDIPNIKKEEIQKCIDYLKESGLFSFIPQISNPSDIDIKNLLITPNKNILKLVTIDPAAFIAVYLCSRGVVTNMLESIRGIFNSNKQIKELLFEATIISHMVRSPVTKRSYFNENIGYVQFEEKELADIMAWYVNERRKLVLLAVEAKSGDIDISEIKNRSKILNEKFNIKRLIVVCNEKKLEITDDYSIIPIEIFLLLL